MADELTMDCPGQSGKTYHYWIYTIGTKMYEEPGNYIFVKQTEPNKWTPLYIGQTGNLNERLSDHEMLPCVRQKGGTHICTHTSTKGEDLRRAEETDLINKWGQKC